MQTKVGIKYEKRQGDNYVIDFIEENAEASGAGKITEVYSSFKKAIGSYNVSANVYHIGYAKLIDLINKHATRKLPAMSIPMDEKQYILNYIDEKLPETFYYKKLITEFAEKMHENYEEVQKRDYVHNYMDVKLNEFINSLVYQTKFNSGKKCRINWDGKLILNTNIIYYDDKKRYITVYLGDNEYSKTSINMGIHSMVNDCVRFLNGE